MCIETGNVFLTRVTYNGKESCAGQSLDGFGMGIVFFLRSCSNDQLIVHKDYK